MLDWKLRQEIYHRLNTEHNDDLNTKDVELTDDVAKWAIAYFNERDIGWIYPSKSYMVGICYARWLATHFGGTPIEYLNDPDLLFGNDPFFEIYSDSEQIYCDILNTIGGWEFDENAGMVPDVRQYFNDEFMIDDNL